MKHVTDLVEAMRSTELLETAIIVFLSLYALFALLETRRCIKEAWMQLRQSWQSGSFFTSCCSVALAIIALGPAGYLTLEALEKMGLIGY